ncbi:MULTISPECIES: hypothetical protein [unclassified Paenibacillus]|uniref:Uncharacterized protein n=1 Tax=Paenibacillus provencensis TaxID=441151 RepID=A0ABW3QC02_9BACL|nr:MULTISPECIES: hypothetical protein [unclassified Paenibacillus]MCM3130618.1 hypothetical protein [Paenibacillus sp. MER 78]SDX74351.1 hypothetical protein SAMN05518848_11352 [Paenibacillus sp. PDC88]SFS89749.1 hypothetical protein SAMN04488601_106172 [Paenibacillus sp. 453mf]
MKAPKRFLKEAHGVFKVVGLSFKPQTTSNQTQETLSIGFKIGDWDNPINLVPYFIESDHSTPYIH